MNALVLEGGGVKGAYQIGSYMALKDNGIVIDGFYGVSIGSINGAIMAAGKEEELLNFWMSLDSGSIFGFEKEVTEAINEQEYDVDFVIATAKSLFKALLNRGIDTEPLLKAFESIVSEEILLNSKKEFGLLTVRVSDEEPIEIYKEDIPKGKLNECILASCYLPVFKGQKLIDDNYYIDGGFYDGCPINMALKHKKYDNVYVIKINGIGVQRPVIENKSKIITIEPRRDNGSIFEMRNDTINDNIKMGYYDTLREIKHYDGYNYVFKPLSDFYLNIISRNIDKREFRRVKTFFEVDNNKDAIIRALEYVLAKEEVDYYHIYSFNSLLRKYRNIDKDHFIYNFVNKLRII